MGLIEAKIWSFKIFPIFGQFFFLPELFWAHRSIRHSRNQLTMALEMLCLLRGIIISRDGYYFFTRFQFCFIFASTWSTLVWCLFVPIGHLDSASKQPKTERFTRISMSIKTCKFYCNTTQLMKHASLSKLVDILSRNPSSNSSQERFGSERGSRSGNKRLNTGCWQEAAGGPTGWVIVSQRLFTAWRK